MSHKNLKGRTPIIESDEILKNFIISEFMAGNNTSSIAKEIKIRFPEKSVNRLTIIRFLDRLMEETLNPENQGSSATQDLLKSFDDTIQEFTDLFQEIKENIQLSDEQLEKLEKHQRKVVLGLNLSKKRWKIFLLQVQMSNTEIQNGLQEFIGNLSGSQKEKLNSILQSLWREDELVKDEKLFQRYQKQKTKLFYRYYPQTEGMEVA